MNYSSCRGITHRSFAAADNLTKFLAEAAANDGLFVRDNESTVRAQPVRRRKNEKQTGGYLNKPL